MIISLIVFLILLLPVKNQAQDTLRFYLNAGYITSIIRPSDCTRPDAGGSFRIGILTKKKLGFHTGYAWFKEYHQDFMEYDDKGSIFLAGIDYRLLRKGNFRGYINIGIGFTINFVERTNN